MTMDTNASEGLIRLMGGAWLAKAIAVAARLGIADLVAAKPYTAFELAVETQADPDIMERLMRLLAACGIFENIGMNRYSNTSVSALLCSNSESSLRHFCMLAGESYYDIWGALFYTVKTGQSACQATFGGSLYDYMEREPEAGRVYDLAMADLARPVGRLLAERAEFKNVHTVVDVGGGNGTVLQAILAAHPHLQGICIERESVCRHSLEAIKATNSQRLNFLPGDFFAPLPKGDVYIVKNVLHNWSDARCVELLVNIRQSMCPDTLLMVLEPFVEPDDSSPRHRMDALLQAVISETGTQARSEVQIKGIVGQAGLKVEETASITSNCGLVLCRRSE
jgi:C-methyltransferase